MPHIKKMGFEDARAQRASACPGPSDLPPNSRQDLSLRLSHPASDDEWDRYVNGWRQGFNLQPEQLNLIGHFEAYVGDDHLTLIMLSYGYVHIIPHGCDPEEHPDCGLVVLRDGTLCVTEPLVETFQAEPRSEQDDGRFRWMIPPRVVESWPDGVKGLVADICDFIEKNSSKNRLKAAD